MNNAFRTDLRASIQDKPQSEQLAYLAVMDEILCTSSEDDLSAIKAQLLHKLTAAKRAQALGRLKLKQSA